MVKITLKCGFQAANKAPTHLAFNLHLSFMDLLQTLRFPPSLRLSLPLKHGESQLTAPLLPDIIALIQAALDLMFVCLERLGAPCFSLIGLTSDVVCVRVYYGGSVVISKPPFPR